jgi:preprotein translocase subunit YajC
VPLLSVSLTPLFAATTAWGPALLGQAEGGGNPLASFLPIVAMGLLAYFLFVVPQRTKDKRFQQMLDGLKENDRIVTTGGLHGVVTNIQRDAGRLTLRIDETTGAKVRVAMWAVDSVVNNEEK